MPADAVTAIIIIVARLHVAGDEIQKITHLLVGWLQLSSAYVQVVTVALKIGKNFVLTMSLIVTCICSLYSIEGPKHQMITLRVLYV